MSVYDSINIYFRFMDINLRLDSRWQMGRDSKAGIFFFQDTRLGVSHMAPDPV